MAIRMHFTCCTVAILIVNLSIAQVFPSYIHPFYPMSRYSNPNLISPQQTLQTSSLSNNFDNYVGLPLLPKLFPDGLPYIPELPHTTLPKGSKLHTLPSPILLLYPNPLISRISPTQVRSMNGITTDSEKSVKSIGQLDDNVNAAEENTPIINSAQQTKTRSSDNNGSDELDFLTTAANPVVEAESMFHKLGQNIKHTMQKIGSEILPQHSQTQAKESKIDDKDDFVPYQVWAKSSANENTNGNLGGSHSVSDIMNNYRQATNYGYKLNPQYRISDNVGPGLGNVMDQFQQSLPQSSFMQNNNSPYGKNNDNDNSNYYNPQQSQNKFVNPMEKFWNAGAKFSNNAADNASGLPKNEQSETSQLNNPMGKLWNSAVKMADNIADSVTNNGKSGNEPSGFDQSNNPSFKFWEKASDMAKMPGNFMNPGNNQFFGSSYGAFYPMHQSGYNPNLGIWNAASDMAGRIANAGINVGYYGQMMNPYISGYGGNYYQRYSPEGAIWNSASNLAQNIPGNKYFKGSNPMDNFSSQISQDATTYAGQTRNYRQILPFARPLGLPFGIAQTAGRFAQVTQPLGILPQVARPIGLLPQIAPSAGGITQSAMKLAEGIITQNPHKIATAGIGIGTGVATTANQMNPNAPLGGPRFFMKRNSATENIWNSATGLAGSIANVASNPSRGGDQILGSIGSIWNAANNLASNIGNTASNPGNIANQFVGSSNKDAQSPISNPAAPIWNSATDLASNIAKAGNSQTSNPIGTVWNSANNLADSISKSAMNLGSNWNTPLNGFPNTPSGVLNAATGLASRIANTAMNPLSNAGSRLLGPTNPLSRAWSPALNMAGQIVNTAINPMGSYGSGQMLQSYGPYYGGGYFPRNNPAGAIWNSASQLAGNIVNTAANPTGSLGMLQSPFRSNYYLAPLQSVWNSASNLASDVSNVATNPIRWSYY